MLKRIYQPAIFILVAMLDMECSRVQTNQQRPHTNKIPGREWWKEAIVPGLSRSFKDGNGDGVGN